MRQHRCGSGWGRLLFAALALTLGASPAAWGHGGVIQAQSQTGILVTATYETGEPMVNAQVQVYSPDDPRTPHWLGTTDGEGRYFLLPDRAGEWEVAVRQGGHGAITQISVGEGAVVTLTNPTLGGLSPLQRGLMTAAVTWGCVGTALFFWGDRRRSGPGSSSPGSAPAPEGYGGQE